MYRVCTNNRIESKTILKNIFQEKKKKKFNFFFYFFASQVISILRFFKEIFMRWFDFCDPRGRITSN